MKANKHHEETIETNNIYTSDFTRRDKVSSIQDQFKMIEITTTRKKTIKTKASQKLIIRTEQTNKNN